jgi:hypothetical protein
MYCGNFKGKFDQATKPTKILVSLALTKGADLTLEDTIESGILSTSTINMYASTTIDELLLATSTATTTEVVSGTSTLGGGSGEVLPGATTTLVESSSTQVGSDTASSAPVVETVPATPAVPLQETTSAIGEVLQSVKDGLLNLFENTKDTTTQTDTVVTPPAAPSPTPEPAPQEPSPAPVESAAPTSYLPSLRGGIISLFVQKVFAQEVEVSQVITETSTPTPTPEAQPAETQTSAPSAVPVSDAPVQAEVNAVPSPLEKVTTGGEEVVTTGQTIPASDTNAMTSLGSSTSTADSMFVPLVIESTSTEPGTSQTPSILDMLTNTFSSLTSSTTDFISTTTQEQAATTTEENVASSTEITLQQNNFLEVFYTFDGVTWLSLGELDEVSMKYRTFEIPITASTTWEDMNRLQIKVLAKRLDHDTPTVYLDAIKVEVLYESTLLHAHPDFARDTILKDETYGDMRLVTIINNENNLEEIWYMYLDATSTSLTASTSLLKNELSSTTMAVVDTTITTATTTARSATATDQTSNSVLDATTTVDIFTDATSTTASTTEATSTIKLIKPVIQKNVWMKFTGVQDKKINGIALAEAIRSLDETKVDPDEVVKREKPDFTIDFIRKIKGTFLNSVVVQLEKEGSEELWLYDVENGTEEKVVLGTSTSLLADSPLGVKGGHIFWLSKDRDRIFAYTIETKELQEALIPGYDIAKGERGEVIFESIPWKVIVDEDAFLFYSDTTGEVFSDENGAIAETLRNKLDLDAVLDKEELSNLNFHVDEQVPLNE